MKVEIIIEVDEGDPSADPDHPVGLTNSAYERVINDLRWLGEIYDINKLDEED